MWETAQKSILSIYIIYFRKTVELIDGYTVEREMLVYGVNKTQLSSGYRTIAVLTRTVRSNK